ncbi:MAG: hypothetical protein WA421_11895, partial [Nitrososphaeraceae archaeon]
MPATSSSSTLAIRSAEQINSNSTMKLEELSIELLKWCKYDGVTDRDRCLYRNNIFMYTYMETFHLIDAGRVLQNMQLAAWNHGIGSG